MRTFSLRPWNMFNNCLMFLFVVVLFLLVMVSSLESHFIVKTLPGFVGDLPFTLETGYIGVGESEDVQLFYYFIESEGNPKHDPLMLWLAGGPSCSGLTAIFYEIGPFVINFEESNFERQIVEKKPHSWTKAANMIFIDHPAGSGFSYAKNSEAYTTNDTASTMLAYDFLKKWLVDHPKYINNPFYIGGESYAGIVVPMIVQEIYNGIEVGEEPHINFKGYVLGNPLTDKSGDYNSRIPFANNMALISDEIYKSAKENCGGKYLYVDPNNTLCIHDLQVVDKCFERIFNQMILEPNCTSNTFKSNLASLDTRSLPQLKIQGCREDSYVYSYVWANRRDVREALNIREEFESIEWVRCNETFLFNYDKKAKSYTHNVPATVAYHRGFADKKCRALIYNGDHDMLVSYLSTLNWIKSLNLSIIDDWRPWFVDQHVAGYTTKYSHNNYNLTYATVKGGGLTLLRSTSLKNV